MAGKQVPEEVLALLSAAYPDDLGESGQQLPGHLVETGNQPGLMYGELLPEGVSLALARLGAHSAGGDVLELGMGTGKVALQAFLECPGRARVAGVELSAKRFEEAVSAAERLAAAAPDRFRLELKDGRADVLEAGSPGRRLELARGDLAELPAAAARQAGVVFLQVVLPEAAMRAAQRLLLEVPDGCVAFLLHDLADSWCLPEPCPLHAEGGAEDRFAVSWSPRAGHRFFVYRCDRSRAASITRASAERALAEAAAAGHEL